VTNGIAKLIAVNLDTMDWWEIADSEAFCLLKGDAMARFDDTAVLAISTGVAVAETLYRFDIRGPAFCKAIRSSADMPMPRGLLSRPTPVAIRATQPPARTTYGFLWMPRSPWFTAPAGERPPLIISAHGGPTGYSGCGLAPRVQYFTSRGYAFLALNYAGSTAHGRRYRNALFGSWGLLDVDDAAEAAGALVRDGTVRPGAVGLTGLSAGGYSTLMGLARHPRAFAGGVAVSSISDVRRWAATTHKLEADYAPALALPAGTKKADEARVYRERSALFAADEVAAPLLIIHGEADAVVPLEQATLMADALRARGADVRLVTVKGEGHQVNKPASARLWLEEEERWWRRTLL
jgi:dienelactone hydrolase